MNEILLPHLYETCTEIFAFMCCPFIVPLMIGVSNKAHSDACDCLSNEFQVTLLYTNSCKDTSLIKSKCDDALVIMLAAGCCQCNGSVTVPSNYLYVCVCRLLQDHHSVQSRSDRCAVCRLLHSPLPAHWRESSPYRRYRKT